MGLLVTTSGMSNGPNATLIVPTITPSGSLHFAEVSEDALAQDVIHVLIQMEGLKENILGDLEDNEWALQRIRLEENGRPWEEEELMALGDGVLHSLIIFHEQTYSCYQVRYLQRHPLHPLSVTTVKI